VANDSGRGDSGRGEYIDKTVQIKRCAAVVKGGRRFSFAALVVVGDGKGKVGWGYGKANEVPPAVEKAQKQASRSLVSVPLVGAETIPHYSRAKYGSADVMLMPAGAGTGVIAGAAVRAVCEAAGIKNIITKSFNTSNQVTVVKATIEALRRLRTQQDIERLRGVTLA
jgi:small subunit ribosomal protein S5